MNDPKSSDKNAAHLAFPSAQRRKQIRETESPIVPPPEFHARKSGDYSDVDDYIIDQPVKEKIEGHSGIYVKTNRLYRRSMSVREYRALAKRMPGPKVYGADTPGSICDKDLAEFNMNNLGTVLDLLDESGVKIKGVNTVYLYFGMWKATFPWHPEDMDLYSINYVHFGEPKVSDETLFFCSRLASYTFFLIK
ncbi:unnamed protein product [Gongylonema pulchrum]|uniref:JmjC domain-containing protein n=2 Tax=Gongylonema pulchrum TaxID=637853 RepID=A0A3P6QQ17_9BILA|nr:unnamed protein product [Gongylonema pulchrum]